MNQQATQTLDLEPYMAGRGLPDKHRRRITEQIEQSIVAGVDREHNTAMIAHCDATSDFLYSQYTPKAPTYTRGARPMLERIADGITSRFVTESEQVQALVTWVVRNVPHAKTRSCVTPSDLAPTEERLIEKGWGWCNEQGRLLVALAQIAGYPARMCFLFHKKAPSSHATTEIFFNNKWVFVDPTFGCFICGDPDRPYSAKDIQRDPVAKKICDDQHRRARVAHAIWHDAERIPAPSARPMFDPAARASDYFTDFALCNYQV